MQRTRPYLTHPTFCAHCPYQRSTAPITLDPQGRFVSSLDLYSPTKSNSARFVSVNFQRALAPFRLRGTVQAQKRTSPKGTGDAALAHSRPQPAPRTRSWLLQPTAGVALGSSLGFTGVFVDYGCNSADELDRSVSSQECCSIKSFCPLFNHVLIELSLYTHTQLFI